jgi:hypothetical protein
MSLFDITGVACFLLYTSILISFIFWWSFIEEESGQPDHNINSIDPLRAFCLFLELNLRKLYLLGKSFRFYFNEALLLSVLFILRPKTPARRGY